MRLTPKEIDRLTVFTLAELAHRRRERGLKLNHPESMAIICDIVFEEARAGQPYDVVVEQAMTALTRDDVLAGVPELIGLVQVDALFPDGTRLITLRNPNR